MSSGRISEKGTISFLGMAISWFAVVLIRRLRSMANPFGHMIGSQAIAEATHLTLIAVYYCPMVFFDIEFLKRYSHYCGVLLIVFFEIALYSHVIISINRFCAIYYPLHYGKIFSLVPLPGKDALGQKLAAKHNPCCGGKCSPMRWRGTIYLETYLWGRIHERLTCE
ncbi:unnamed protein product [Heligmosomoides polygyrus]|uniref:7TM_GPCR_Srx domain-containing protein n=1 Tax=Heligmosomoides polygyrus TaxID=6339 RepID=A0A183FHW4_HELPZ|nr:unnamed protein product [Heligmosomoides polygyrus]